MANDKTKTVLDSFLHPAFNPDPVTRAMIAAGKLSAKGMTQAAKLIYTQAGRMIDRTRPDVALPKAASAIYSNVLSNPVTVIKNGVNKVNTQVANAYDTSPASSLLRTKPAQDVYRFMTGKPQVTASPLPDVKPSEMISSSVNSVKNAFLAGQTKMAKAGGKALGEGVNVALDKPRVASYMNVLLEQAKRDRATAASVKNPSMKKKLLGLAEENENRAAMAQNEYNKTRTAAMEKNLKTVPATAADIAFRTLGGKGGPVGLGIGGVIGGGLAALQGKNVFEGMGQGASEAEKYAGINRITGPLTSAAMGRLAGTLWSKAHPVLTTLAASGIAGGTNVAEDELVQRLNGTPPSAMARIESFLIGAGIYGGQRALGMQKAPSMDDWNKLKDDLTRDLSTGEKREVSETIRLVRDRAGKLRDQLGQFAREAGESVEEYKNRLDNVKINDLETGEKITLKEFMKKYGKTGAIDLGAEVGGTPRPQHQIDFENAWNAGDVKKAQQIVDSLPDDDPYKESMTRLMDQLQAKSGQIPASASPPNGSKTADNGNSGSNGNPPDDFEAEMDALAAKGQTPAGIAYDRYAALPKKEQYKGVGIPIDQPELTGPVKNPEKPFYNVNTLDVEPKTQKQIADTIEAIKPNIEEVTGGTMKNKDVLEMAKKTADISTRVIGIDETKEMAARNLALRQELAKVAKTGQMTKEYLDLLMADKTQSESIARLLQARSIKAKSGDRMPMNVIIDALVKKGVAEDDILKAAEGVDFNDQNQATRFYREFISPKVTEWIDTLRYNSMLSSPNTHINNAASNLLNSAVVAPVEKTVAGAVDFLGSTVTGKPQTHFAGEGAAYTKGYWSAVGEATKNFVKEVKGTTELENLDLRHVPLATEGVSGAAYKTLSVPMRLLSAMDTFFQTMTKAGELSAQELKKAKGVDTGSYDDMLEEATKQAKYRLYRQGLQPDGQGVLLDAVDKLTGQIMSVRNSDNPLLSGAAKIALPFVQTPMNIFKQFVEYSPAGVATIPGAKDKVAQVTKALMGTAVFTTAYMTVASGRATAAVPTNAKEKDAFYAAGMQPWSLKVGDTWIAYSKLPPVLAAPFALVSSIQDAVAHKKITDQTANLILKSVANWGTFFADQSYVRQIGDLVAGSKGDLEKKLPRQVSNVALQFVPFRAFGGWMSRLTDHIQRKTNPSASFIDQMVQELFMNIPGASTKVPARTDKNGQPIPSQHPILNSFSPVKISSGTPETDQQYQAVTRNNRINSVAGSLKAIKTAAAGGAMGIEKAAGKIADINAKIPSYLSDSRNVAAKFLSGPTDTAGITKSLSDARVRQQIKDDANASNVSQAITQTETVLTSGGNTSTLPPDITRHLQAERVLKLLAAKDTDGIARLTKDGTLTKEILQTAQQIDQLDKAGITRTDARILLYPSGPERAKRFLNDYYTHQSSGNQDAYVTALVQAGILDTDTLRSVKQLLNTRPQQNASGGILGLFK